MVLITVKPGDFEDIKAFHSDFSKIFEAITCIWIHKNEAINRDLELLLSELTLSSAEKCTIRPGKINRLRVWE